MSDDKYELITSMDASISEEIEGVISEIGEIGLDLFCDEGILKEIPFVSTAISLFKIGSNIHDKHNLNKLYAFIVQLNTGISNEFQRLKYSDYFKNNKKKRTEELEYLILIIDRYISCDKSSQLAKIFLTYLDQRIKWLDVCKYAEVIDRFLPGDYAVLKSNDTYKTERDFETDAIQRLIAQGLVIEGFRTSNIQEEDGALIIDAPQMLEKRERNYTRTEFGNVLVSILT